MSAAARAFELLDARGKRQLPLVFGLILIGAMLEAVGIGIVMPFIALINDPTYLDRQVLLQRIYQLSGFGTREEFIVACAIALLVVFVVKNAFLALTVVLQNRFVYGQMLATSRQLYTAYLQRPYSFHLQSNTAVLIRNITNEVVMVYINVIMPALILLTELCVVLTVLILLLWLSPVPTMVALVLLGGVAGSFYYAVRKKVRKLAIEQQASNGRRIKWINEGLGGIKEIKVLGREQFFIDGFNRYDAVFVEASRHAMTLNQMPRFFIETVAVAALLLGVIAIVSGGGEARQLLPLIALFAVAGIRLLPSINRITMSVVRILYYLPAVHEVHKDLRARPVASMTVVPHATHSLLLNHGIELEDVTYSYPNTGKPALQEISIVIPKGSAVAILGPSGAGKTTLVDVLLGLLTPNGGSIRVDGRDIRDNLRCWQDKIGYIPQHIFLSDDTVRRNVAFGVPDGAIDERKVWAALKMASLEEHVRSLVDGLDTIVGERGAKLSGGQRQRIGIARALYHDPDILVLDEATSALDSETEREISATIEGLQGQKTLIIIAHRHSTIEKCRIRYELRAGRLIS